MIPSTIILYSTVVEEAEVNNPNDNFHERKLFRLVDPRSFDKAIKFLNNNCLTATNKTASVNYKDYDNWSTLMIAARYQSVPHSISSNYSVILVAIISSCIKMIMNSLHDTGHKA